MRNFNEKLLPIGKLEEISFKKFTSNFLLTIPLAFIVLFSSCSSGEEGLKLLSDDTYFIASTNIKKLGKKGKLADFSQEDIVEEIIDRNDVLEELMEDPKMSGIDFSEDVFFFVFGEEDETTIGICMTMRNEEKFEIFLEDLMDEADRDIDIDKEDDYLYAISGDRWFAWNDDVVFIGFTDIYRKDDVEDMIEDIMTNDESRSFYASEYYKDFSELSDDINVIVTEEILGEFDDLKDAFKDIEKDVDLEFRSFTAGIQFSKGELEFATYINYQDESEKILKNMDPFQGKPSGKILGLLPSENFLGGMSISIDKKGIKEFLKKSKSMVALLDEVENESDIDLIDLLDAVGEDFYFVVYDVSNDYYESSIDKFGIGYTTKAKDHLNMLADFFEDMNDRTVLTENNLIWYTSRRDSVIFIKNGNNVIISKSIEILPAMEDKVLTLDKTPFADYLTNDAINITVNFDPATLSNETIEMLNEEMYFADNGFDLVSDVIKGFSVSGSANKMSAIINFKDHETNALEQILNFVNEEIVR
jgi:hypothetical protein